MPISLSLLACLVFIYIFLLLAITYYGEKRAKPLPPKLRATLYSLSLTVYCSGWIFWGAVGQASQQLWSYLPIFLGPALLIIFAPWFLKKMLVISKQETITSIADFIATRYGKSDKIATVVTLVCTLGILPYISLQLKAISSGIELLTSNSSAAGTSQPDTAFVIASILAVLTIVFSVRNLGLSEHHRGVMFAMATDSIIKLIAFIAIAFFASFSLYNNPGSLWHAATSDSSLNHYWESQTNWPFFFVQTCVAMMAMYTLPRLFHVTVVENNAATDFRAARWIFPLYLLIFAICVIPITLASLLSTNETNSDSFIIALPLFADNTALAIIAFIGGVSAAAGMVILSTASISMMIANHVLLPLLLNNQPLQQSASTFTRWSILSRCSSVIFILLLSYLFFNLINSGSTLAHIGQVAFTAFVQLAPAMIGALIWKKANRKGVIYGIGTGMLLWGYTLALPLISESLGYTAQNLPLLHWLYTSPLSNFTDPQTLATLISLGGNFCAFVVVSLFSRTRVSEHWQANRFINLNIGSKTSLSVQVNDLLNLASRFVGDDRARQSFIRFAYTQGKAFNTNETASSEWIAHTERLLTGVLGASSTKAVVEAAIEGREMQVEDVMRIMGEASEALQFNRTLLQGAIENITQGISVVDRSLRLVAWNSKYLKLFDYPEELIVIGRPIADIIRFNAEKGLCGPGDVETHVSKRLYWMRQGTAHTSERIFPNGRVIELIGNPMPGGGFVMSFTDITAFRDAERALKEANESLEHRVVERTKELSELNLELIQAKRTSEEASQSKTRFLAAVSHDLMQPLNAARLFSAALSLQDSLPPEAQELVKNLDHSLSSAEDLISDLLDISRIESGRIVTHVHTFALKPWLETLGAEFNALAQQQGIDFRLHTSNLSINSDPKLLRRIIQNFLTNAFRYAQGQVLLGVRRQGKDKIRIEVWDKGQGIPEDKLRFIFEEFKRLDSHKTREEKGLGLGLAIADGFCRVLKHQLEVKSWVGKGSVFSVVIPISKAQPIASNKPSLVATTSSSTMQGLNVLCIDNEESILTGMDSLLSRWGCTTFTAKNRDECDELFAEGIQPDVVLIDYHLSQGETGIQVYQWLIERLTIDSLPCIVISADSRTETVDLVQNAGLSFLAKPVKPAALRALINKFLTH